MSHLSTGFLQDIIRKFDNDDSIIVESFTEKAAVGNGENFMSIAKKVTVFGKRKENGTLVDFTRKIFRKVPVPSTPVTKKLKCDEIFSNEIIAYSKFIPTLQKYSKKRLSVPKCYYADNNHIILEDLSTSGYEMNVGKCCLEKPQYILVIKELACLHAADITMKFKDKQKYDNLGELNYDIFIKNSMYDNTLIQTITRILLLLQDLQQTDEIKKATTLLTNIKPLLYNKIVDIIADKRDTDVYNHGDCWMNNMLFKNYDESVALLDLQCMRKTSVAADLHYFLNINLDVKELVDNKMSILKTYLDELHECIRQNGCDVDLTRRYDMKWLMEEMERFSLFGFMVGIWVTPILYVRKEDVKSLDNLTEDILTSELGDKELQFGPDLEERFIQAILTFFKDKDIDWKL